MSVVAATSGIDRPRGKIDIPSAWLGAEMKANPDRWLISLGAAEIAELEAAAESYLGRTRKIADITKESFPLPRFGAHLEELKTTSNVHSWSASDEMKHLSDSKRIEI